MITIAVLNTMEVAPHHKHMGQDEDGLGKRNNHRDPHVGQNQPQVVQVLIDHCSGSHLIRLET